MVVNIGENIAYIREEMARAAKKSGRGLSEVKLMGVTKYHPIEMMTEAAASLDLIGENKVQEAAGKRALWPAAVKSCPWHMIGHLQRNKIRRALENFDLIESIDSLETAVGINRVLSEGEPRSFPVFIEVNMSREAAKSGVAPEEAARLLDDMMNACRLVSVEGLMTVAEDTGDEKTLRETFGGLRELREALRRASGLPLSELSMGMSGDFTAAIEEGSTIVRVGSAIFGPRNYG
ncbi:MAG: YggS family pyridoxal phosphate-dependent enzyme [bacterium]|nr:YggS family pyridoxal phosphate-dependent enzyme [bacterium]